MKTFAKRAAMFGSLLLLVPGCELLGEFQGPDICESVATQEFKGGLPIDAAQTVKVSHRVDLSGRMPQSDTYDFELRFKEATFTVLEGAADLGFVDTAKLEVGAGGSEDRTLLFAYAKDPAAQALSPLVVTSTTEENILPLSASGPVTVDLTLSARPPEVDTRVDVKLCFSTHGNKKKVAEETDAGTP